MKAIPTAFLAVAASLLLTLASTASPLPAAAVTEEFSVGVGFGEGFLVRGGLPSCTAHFGCVGASDLPLGSGWEPLTLTLGVPEVGSPGFVSNNIEITSRNGFAGTVILEVLNLPPGVTSQTATFANIAAGNSLTTPFMLQAAGNAPLGDRLVTVRVTSDTRTSVQTGLFRISIVDNLPAPPR